MAEKENCTQVPDLSVNGTPVDIGGQIFAHRSVMLESCMQALAIKPDGKIDLTRKELLPDAKK